MGTPAAGRLGCQSQLDNAGIRAAHPSLQPDQQLYLAQVAQAAHTLRATVGSRRPDTHLTAAQLLVAAVERSLADDGAPR